MFKNIKIGKKLIIAFIAVALIVSISGFAGLGVVINLNYGYNTALTTNGFVQGDIGNYNTYITQGGALVRHMILENDPAKMQAARSEIEEIKDKTTAALEATKLNCQSPEELVIVARIDKALIPYQNGREKAISLALQNKNDEAFQVFCDEVSPYLDECINAGQDLMALNVDMGSKVATKLVNQSDLSFILIVSVILVGFIIATVMGVFIARDISKPLGEIEDVAAKMAKGDYDVDVKYTSRNEIGRLAESMREMIKMTKDVVLDTSRGLSEIADGNFDIAPKAEYVGKFEQIKNAMAKIIIDMSDTMSQIRMSAEQVSSGSDQVSTGSQALAQGATEQASSMQQLSASINEVSDQVNESARNAGSAQNIVTQVGDAINTSNEQMTSMIGAMSEISDSSKEIGKIIKTIEDIAFQTNILCSCCR
ncbi:MAG: MCP four helix bundle domain-containing protein [Oscillospiraceae bacterium]